MTTSRALQSPAEVLGGQVALRSLSDYDLERVTRRTVELLAESAQEGHRRRHHTARVYIDKPPGDQRPAAG